MKNGKLGTLVICFLLVVVSSVQNISMARGKVGSVSFTLEKNAIQTSSGKLDFHAWLNASINVDDGSLEPNGTSSFSVSFTPDTLNITLVLREQSRVFAKTWHGTNDPFTLTNDTIPEEGNPNGNESLRLSLIGRVAGRVEVEGKATIDNTSTVSIGWSTPGSKLMTLKAGPETAIGEMVNITLRSINYTLWVMRIEDKNGQSLFNSLLIMSDDAGIASIQGTFKVEYPFSWRMIVGGGIISLGFLSLGIGVLYLRTSRELENIHRKGTRKSALPVEKADEPISINEAVCPNCGASNTPGAKFCKKCGKQL